MSIRVGIIGYGNLGRGVECAIKQNKDRYTICFSSSKGSNITIEEV